MSPKPQVSIITVHYKITKEFKDFLNSIKQSKTKVGFELIIVDNDTKGKIRNIAKKIYPDSIYVNSGANIGYGQAVNLGSRYAKGEYLFVINPDTVIMPECIDRLYIFSKSIKRLGVAGP